MKNIYCLLLYISLFLPGLGQADEFIKPSARLSAEEVVEIQLLGLQAAGDDRPAGIEQVWRFAHPDNRKMTGPITRFPGSLICQPMPRLSGCAIMLLMTAFFRKTGHVL